ncbi:hypothetical protein N7474_007364, partial [Penicillium riverlandense]|uniref:uncharacterized protein n=1 Tax=Penicillium riverlandense TaxID=1903569 RepID=UPI002549AA8F
SLVFLDGPKALFMGYCTTALIYGFAGGSKPVAELSLHDFEQCLKARKINL